MTAASKKLDEPHHDDGDGDGAVAAAKQHYCSYYHSVRERTRTMRDVVADWV